LSAFKAEGGKMIHWHGIADQSIPVNGDKDYYTRFEALDPDVRDSYRYFEVPGVQHCAGGPGLFPVTALEPLVKCVEKDEAPGSIEGISGNVKRPIFAWPLVAA
jgi:feruloyl esterase